ncbi:MAG: hypothetical protein DRO12_06175 [Thermoprotei archaeon]|nr:MAG: hypothetical protein DRO12_06175 [Thermoprotei archaeon]
MKPQKKEIIIKAFLYRFFVILYELTLATILGLIGFTVTGFIIANNLFKILGYVIFELWWFRYLKTRFKLLEKLILKRLRKSDNL